MLIEEALVPAAALPVTALHEHLRLGSGFGADPVQDAVLERALRAAIAVIEARTGKALVARAMVLRVPAWRDRGALALPVAPVQTVAAVRLVAQDGNEETLDPARWRLVRDLHRPALEAVGGCFPSIPSGGVAAVDLTAGFGPDWAAVPADLSQAVLMLAAQYFAQRGDGDAAGGAIPAPVGGLIGRWVRLRGFGGAFGGSAR